MLLGKRPRHRIRRTTSVTSISVDHLEDPQEPSSARQNPSGDGGPPRAAVTPDHHDGDGGGGEDVDMGGFGPYDRQSSFLAMVSPRNYNSMEAEGAHFLTTCGLCKRRLFPGDGRDIYMYRGDTAFCSLECREEQVKQDEKKEKHKNPNVAANSRRQARKASPN